MSEKGISTHKVSTLMQKKHLLEVKKKEMDDLHSQLYDPQDTRLNEYFKKHYISILTQKIKEYNDFMKLYKYLDKKEEGDILIILRQLAKDINRISEMYPDIVSDDMIPHAM